MTTKTNTSEGNLAAEVAELRAETQQLRAAVVELALNRGLDFDQLSPTSGFAGSAHVRAKLCGRAPAVSRLVEDAFAEREAS